MTDQARMWSSNILVSVDAASSAELESTRVSCYYNITYYKMFDCFIYVTQS